MDFLITKFYEFLIKRKIKKNFLKHKDITFQYSLLVGRGFTEYFTEPNTRNRVTVHYYSGYCFAYVRQHKTFKNIKEAYYYFK